MSRKQKAKGSLRPPKPARVYPHLATVREEWDQTPTYRYIEARLLKPHPKAQRDAPSAKLIAQIASDAKAHGIGTLTVNDAGQEYFWVIDGQRRVAALMTMGQGNYKCHCEVWKDLSDERAADIFRLRQRQRASSQYDDFSKGVLAKDEICIAITKICVKHQWHIVQSNNNPGECSAVRALRKVWDQDGSGALLDRTVEVLTEIYQHDARALSGNIVQGMGDFLKEANGLDSAAFVKKVRQMHPGPDRLIQRAKLRRESEGGSIPRNVSAILAKTYTSRRKRI